MAGAKDLFQGIQHTGANIAVHHTNGAQCEGGDRRFASRRHKNQPSSKTGLLFRVTAILRLFLNLDYGGQALKDSAV